MSLHGHHSNSNSRMQSKAKQKLLILILSLTLGFQLPLIASEESSVSELSEGYINVSTTTNTLLPRPSEENLDGNKLLPSGSGSSTTNETSIPSQTEQKLERADAEGENDSDSDSEEEVDVDERPSSSSSSSTPPAPTSSPTPTRPQPLIIKSHPILTSASMSTSSGSSSGTTPTNSQTRQKPSRRKPPGSGSASGSDINPIPSLPTSLTDILPTISTVKNPLLMTHPKTEEQVYNSHGQVQSQTPNPLKSQLDDLFTKLNAFPHLAMVSSPIPSSDGILQNFHSIKDAYFEVLERLRDFRNTVSKRFESIENELRETTKMLNETMNTQANIILQQQQQQEQELQQQKRHEQEQQQQPTSPDLNNSSMQNFDMKISEMERRFNISRWVDYCVHYILSNNIGEATLTWSKVEMITAPNVEETSEYLRDIVHLVYARNNSNISPIFPFLRKIHGVEKLPLYDFLINGMKIQDDFDGSEIFYIAQYLKERNAVRSSIYAKIPKAIQYAVSGRNINFVYNDKRTGRHYLHVRDDQIRRDRLNFYVQASQSYTDSRAAVWTTTFEPVSDTFRIRNSLYGDYMYVNEEGFVETIPANMATSSGLEFNFIWKKNSIMIQSKSYMNDPLVVVRGGGKFPYYFSLMRENAHSPVAEFLVEPDTLLE